jgi:hypothetical protein
MGNPEFEKFHEIAQQGLDRLAKIEDRISRLEDRPMTTPLADEGLVKELVGLQREIHSEVKAIRGTRRWLIGTTIAIAAVLAPVLLAATGFMYKLGTDVARLDASTVAFSNNMDKNIGRLETTISTLSTSVQDFRGSVDKLTQRVSYMEGTRDADRERAPAK